MGDIDEAKAFSYKPIKYMPIEGMVEETKEVREAYQAKKALEREALLAKMRAEHGDDGDIDLDKLCDEAEAAEGGKRRKKKKRGKAVDAVADKLAAMSSGAGSRGRRRGRRGGRGGVERKSTGEESSEERTGC